MIIQLNVTKPRINWSMILTIEAISESMPLLDSIRL